MAKLPVKEIEKLIYPVSFYRNKARLVKATASSSWSDFGGEGPDDAGGAGDAAGRGPEDGEPGHDPRVREPARTSASTRTCTGSRTGWAGCGRGRRRRPNRRSTRRTEPRWWPYINLYLVTWGQNVCRPVVSTVRRLRDRAALSENRRARSEASTRVAGGRSRRRCEASCVGDDCRTARARGCSSYSWPSAAWSPTSRRRAAPSRRGAGTPGAGPVIVVETAKGTFEFETYPNEAPKTVAHIVELVKKSFYNGLRFHRVVPGFVMQVGDPQTRDMTRRRTLGHRRQRHAGRRRRVLEASTSTSAGAVAMAHPGNPREGRQPVLRDARPPPALDGKYSVFGQVISGMDVPAKIQRRRRDQRKRT